MKFLAVGGQLGHQSLKAVLLGAQSGLKDKITPSGKKEAAKNSHGKKIETLQQILTQFFFKD